MGAAEESVLSGCPALGRVVARGSNDRRAPARMARILIPAGYLPLSQPGKISGSRWVSAPAGGKD